MRIRNPFLGAFVLELLGAGYASFIPIQLPKVNDHILHVLVFFILTLTFYFILDTTRRRTFNFTLSAITLGFGVVFELGRSFWRNANPFDPLIIAANVVGSAGALGLCTLYHKRMLERKRRQKGYGVVPQDGQEDVELQGQESGVTEGDEDEDLEAWDDMDGGGGASNEVIHDDNEANSTNDKK